LIRHITTLTLVHALLGAGAAWASAAPAPRDLTLRLTDLDPGYAPFGRCKSEPALAEAVRFANRNCVIEFVRFWATPESEPDPPLIASAAAVFESTQRAAAVLTYPRYVASLAFDTNREDLDVVEPAPAIGDEAVALRGADGSAVVLWRSGAVLAGLWTDQSWRTRDRASLPATLALAVKQQARIASPTPLPRDKNDYREVALDDPGLDLPVWWLGQELPRRGALPALRFAGSLPGDFLGSGRHDLGPVLVYGRRGSRADVILQLARPGVLRRPGLRRELRRMRRNRCNLVRRAALRNGRATVFQRSPHCPKLEVRKTAEALDDTTAVVVLHGVVVLIYADDCVDCHGPVSRYESIAGMRRIVRALHPRAAPRAVAP
jgi:hypothetical protein